MATSQQQAPQEKKASSKLGTRTSRAVAKRERLECLSTARTYTSKKRNATWNWQDAIYTKHTPTAYAERKTHGCKHAKWIAHHWEGLADTFFNKYVDLQDHAKAICYVFRSYCSEALAVASCESGVALSIHATNGQYLGMFQMGSSERAKYGHGDTALEQAIAAHKYFVASGKDWSPWSCQP